MLLPSGNRLNYFNAYDPDRRCRGNSEPLPRRATRCQAKAQPNWVLRPAAARRASLRRSVLASGARSNPSTRHKSRGNYSLRLTARTNALIAPTLSPIGTNGYTRYWWQKSIQAQSSHPVSDRREARTQDHREHQWPGSCLGRCTIPNEQAQHWHHLHHHMGLYY